MPKGQNEAELVEREARYAEAYSRQPETESERAFGYAASADLFVNADDDAMPSLPLELNLADLAVWSLDQDLSALILNFLAPHLGGDRAPELLRHGDLVSISHLLERLGCLVRQIY